ncbi:3-oxoacyl-[acyl-carrier-protein] synthase-3 [Saccharothrix tamanrassetensis]|uniref:3-oxoacyl-[acyl-carrier-protein] synthase-3 n=1 Tax=Saccharothrix tamanrassetensis TaxID=1051531 RepID=A0A841C8C6_9PSEU|nr:3-oxoacyl-[acyl-carrier-protein] synthase III C-terminal domain-containing protein [Saccharothrix tamanrassetensis]MBB5953659.1 3-oxoacyl-[acyl-carrier-protein] synthase-3 [Saccharothrix tamanrassetensis]
MAGVVDFEVAFPDGRLDLGSVARRAGLPLPDVLRITHSAEFPALGPGERSVDLAVEAAKALLKRSAAAPDDITHVVYAGSGEWDVPFWSPAAHAAAELGIANAHCFEVANFCNAAATAISVALDKIELGRADVVLVLVADRLSTMVDHDDPGSKELFNFGDAAGAVLLGRDGVSFEVLGSRMRTDPTWSHYYHGVVRDDRVVIRREPHRPGLTAAYLGHFTELTDRVLADVGQGVGDVAWFLVNHGDRDMHRKVLGELGIPPERSVFNYDRLGHMGGVDVFIALRSLLDDRRLRPGDLLLFATSAMGFSWAVTAVRFTPPRSTGEVRSDAP